MAVPAMLEHGRDARGTRSSRREEKFRNGSTEATHREHGAVPEIFSVHSVVNDRDPACG
jgi:hypothetical protein